MKLKKPNFKGMSIMDILTENTKVAKFEDRYFDVFTDLDGDLVTRFYFLDEYRWFKLEGDFEIVEKRGV